MTAAVSPLAAWAEEAKRVTEGVAGRVENQGSAFTDTKHKVEPPQQVPDKPFLNDYLPWQTDYDEVVSANKAVTDRNIQAVTAYGSTTTGNLSSLPTFTPPPSIETHVTTPESTPVDPGYRDHSADPTRNVTHQTSVDRRPGDPVSPPPVRPTDPTPPGGSVVQPPPATVDPSWAHPGQYGGVEPVRPPVDSGNPRPVSPHPHPLVPVLPPGGGGGQHTSAPTPRPPVRAGLPGPGQGQAPGGRPGMPGAGPGTGFGPRGSAGFGPGPQGPLGPGGGTATGNPGSGPRPASFGPEVPPNRAGAGMAGGMSAGAGRKEEDTQHQRPHYLVETEDIFGDGRRVAPPVLGERPPQR
ncbi:hypothetical protein GCM10012275_02220 [Longimycelium tulufanense]|uniref:Uncharacterized protein n=1 Tax=Longimycelium tulufanense TaxID=907463 RepID=A0A8J3FSD5_9PSEU|nr:hypothetical protein [Longimycelium tulufanense]GGM34465.1 hypothetical protein GCM10012275_02220 [Longimycelium tulufanense]